MPRNEFDALRHFAGVLLQQGRVTLDADSSEDKYVHLRRSLLDLAQSLDRNLGWGVFEPNDQRSPAAARRAREPGWTDANERDPGVTLVELLANVADRLDAYADDVAEEARLRSRRRGAAVIAVLVVALAWRAKCRR